jgi:hypothetical protein
MLNKKGRLSMRRRRTKDSTLELLTDETDQLPLKSDTADASQRQADSARQLLTTMLT